jgi:hypothetical protein
MITVAMIPQESIDALNTQKLKDASERTLYESVDTKKFINQQYWYRMQEIAAIKAKGISGENAQKLLTHRDEHFYRGFHGASKCYASQKTKASDTGYVSPKAVRWMDRVLVYANMIIPCGTSKYGTKQFIPNNGENGNWRDIEPWMIDRAKMSFAEMKGISQKEEDANTKEENNFSFFESLHRSLEPTNIPKEYYIEETEEMYQQDTNTESFNNPVHLDDATLDAPHLDIIQEEVPETVDLPINIKGYTTLQSIALDLGLSTIQEVLRHLVVKHLKEKEETKKEETKNKESKSQSPVEEVVSLDATQPGSTVEKEAEQTISPVPVTPQKTVYGIHELTRRQKEIERYLTDKQKEFDIPGVDELINQEKHRITRLPDDLLMSYPIPNPDTEDALQGIVSQHRTSAKRKDTAFTLGNMFKSALERLDIEEIKYVTYTSIDALTRNDSEIMSYIIL